MAQLSESDRRDMQNAAAQALVGGGSAALTEMAAVDLSDIQDFFCKHWDEVKAVLQFIADKVGGIVGWGVRAIIAAGDLLKGRICH